MLKPMETSVLTTPDGAWRFAIKQTRAALDRWVKKLWELDGAAAPARERELPRGDISLIVNLEGRHAADYGFARESPSHSSQSHSSKS
jgi:hypothetical protein